MWHTCYSLFLLRFDPSRLLLTFGATINKADTAQNNTPLHWASKTGNTAVIKMLLDQSASMDALNGQVDHTMRKLFKCKIGLLYTFMCIYILIRQENANKNVVAQIPEKTLVIKLKCSKYWLDFTLTASSPLAVMVLA